MFYVYSLQHAQTKEFYYGYTEALRRRIDEHRRADNAWMLIYYEAYRSELDARHREQKLKHYGQARTHLKNRFRNSVLE